MEEKKKTIEFNADQKDAINIGTSFLDDKNKNVLVSAAAGSGKTTVLVERIIKLLEVNKDFSLKDMVIMTFTVKAAADMKKKIKKAIDERLRKDPDNDRFRLSSELLPSVDISTIDSFCKRIVDVYYDKIPKDDEEFKNYDPSFRVADEKELAIIYNDVLDDLLEKKYADKKYQDFFSSYIEKFDDSKIKNMLITGYNKLGSIHAPIKFLQDRLDNFDDEAEECKKNYVDYNLEWYRQLYDCSKIIFDNLKVKYNDAYSSLKKNGKDTSKSGNDLKKIIDEYLPRLEKLVKKLSDIKPDKNSIKTYNDEYNSLSGYEIPKKNNIGLSDDSDYDLLKSKLKKITEGLEKLPYYEDILNIDDKYAKNAHEKIYIELLKELYLGIAKTKAKKSVIAIGDYAKITLSILYQYDKKKNEFVISENAKEISKKIKTIFVDEYQDTNGIQEKILSALTNDFENKNAFMVGDIKQCIYCFRNSEPENFAKKFDAYDSADNDKEINQLIKLNENHRSREEILFFVNNLFEKIMLKQYGNIDYKKDGMLKKSKITDDIEVIGEKYVEVCGIYDENYNNGLAELSLAKEKEKEEKKQKKEEKEGKKSSTKKSSSTLAEKYKGVKSVAECEKNLEKYKYIDGFEYEAEYVARRIDELVKNNKNIQYKHIVILLRNLKDNAEYFVNALAKRGIPSYAELKRGFFNRFEIKLMLSILRIIDNPLQSIEVASVITSNLHKVSNTELAFLKIAYQVKHGSYNFELYNAIKYFIDDNNIKEIKKDSGISDEEYNVLKEKLKDFIDLLDDLTFKSRYLSISELINSIYEKTDIKDIVYAMPDGKMRIANLETLYQNAIAYQNTSYVGLFNFLRYIEKMIKREDDQGLAKTIDENDDVVRIMTIHSSKGLEFPIVFLCSTQKEYNSMDQKNAIQYNQNYGFALQYINSEKRYSFDTPKYMYFKNLSSDKLRQEEMRLLYVAMTRAKNKLIITTYLSNESRQGGHIPVYSVDKLNEDIKINKQKNDLSTKLYNINNIKNTNFYIDFIMDNYPFGEKYSKLIDVNMDILDVKNNATKNAMTDKNEASKKTKKEDAQKFDYPYKDVLSISPKFSVSAIKKQVNDAVNEKKEGDEKIDDKRLSFVRLNSDKFYDDQNVNDDKIIRDEKNADDLEGSVRGTAYHRFMQFFDYDKNEFVCVNKEKDQYLKEKIIDKEKINKFLLSNLGKNMAKANKDKRLYREHRFMKLYSQNEINKFTGDNEKKCDEKNVIIQGIIDAFYIDTDNSGNEYIVLIDYKTDKIMNKKIDKETLKKELIEHYKVQLDIYSDILKQLTGLDVKEKYIYSFALDEEIAI